MPRFSSSRAENRGTLKRIVARHRQKGRAVGGAIGGIEKRHTDIVTAARDLRAIVSTSAQLLAMAGSAEHSNRQLTPQQMRRMHAQFTAVHRQMGLMIPVLKSVTASANADEAAHASAALAAKETKKQLDTFVADTMRETCDLANDITSTSSRMQACAPLRSDTKPADEQGRIITTLMQIRNPDRSFHDATDVLFTTARGSGARRPNLPGTLAARARAARGVTPVKPEAASA